MLRYKKYITRFFFGSVLLFSCYSAQAQSILESIVELNTTANITVGEILDELSVSILEIEIAYSPDILNVNREIELPREPINLERLLDLIIQAQDLNYILVDNRRILFFRPTRISYTGFVRDANSSEPLHGAYIASEDEKVVTVTNENGYYSFSDMISDKNYKISYIGYEPAVYSGMELRNGRIGLKVNNQINPVIITDDSEGSEYDQIATIEFSDKSKGIGVFGANNPLEQLKSLPGVHSGNEGHTGLFVRGGSPDQNLILFNGTPMYETSHVVGLSSIFMSDDLNQIEFYKDEIPARFGGRLSSVINVQSKRGNKKEYHGNASASLLETQVQVEGPIIKDKLSFNISARQSLIGLYVDTLISNLVDFDDTNVDFNDLNMALHYRINSGTELFLTAYQGEDVLNFKSSFEQTRDPQNRFSFTDNSELSWGNSLVGLQFSSVLSPKFFLKLEASLLKYKYLSQVTLNFENLVDGQREDRVIDVYAYSLINDRNSKFRLDYYANNNHKLSVGGWYRKHFFNPALQQATVMFEGNVEELVSGDSLIHNASYGGFVEYSGNLSSILFYNFGSRLSFIDGAGRNYSFFEPRISIQWVLSPYLRTSFGYFESSQHVHLLTNPGVGIPSDLWVPSSRRIKPETARQVTLGFSLQNNKNAFFSLKLYRKWSNNLIEYEGVNSIFSAVVNENDQNVTFQDQRDWEDNVVFGSGFSTGVELAYKQKIGPHSFVGSYTLSKTERTFDAIDNGQSFPYKFDRKHDLSLEAKVKFTSNWGLTTNFSFGSGTAYSLSIEEFKTSNCDTILVPNARNSLRLPDFHHLDVYVSYQKDFADHRLVVSAGVYNIYNRLNPFYVYLYNNELADERRIRQVSLFPILPTLNARYSF